MKSSKIIGTGSFLPQKVLTNFDLEKIVDTSNEWIITRTGILERRISDENSATSDLAIQAALKALKMADLKADEIGLIIVGTTTPDTLFPSTACIVQDALKAFNSVAFDISAACSGFNYALTIAHNFVSSDVYKNALVIGADTLTKYLNWQDRNTCVLFGDGAGAVVLTQCEKGNGILSSYLTAEGSGGKFLVMPGGGSRNPKPKDESDRCIKMDGKEVFKFAVRAMEEGIVKVAKNAGIPLEKIDLIIPHQANVRIIDHVVKKLKIPKEKFYVNLQNYGNTSAASVPIAIDEAYSSKKMKKDDIIALVGFGAGLTSGANLLKWEV